MAVMWYGKIGLTVGEEYLLGYEEGNPNTGDVRILKMEVREE